MMTDVQRTYLPAAGHDWSLPLYDPLVKLMGGDSVRRVLVEQAQLRADTAFSKSVAAQARC